MLRHLHWKLVVAGLALLCLGSQVLAAEVDAKLLPDDTELVAALHVRQALESPLGKKFVVERLRDALKGQAQAEKILKELGFDPFRDLDTMVFAGPGGDNPEKGLLLAYGKYDMAKFQGKAEDYAKTHGDHLKISKAGSHNLYEVTQEGEDKVYVVIASNDLILVSPSKDYLTAALQKVDGQTSAGPKDARLKALLARADTKQTLWFAASAQAFPKNLPVNNAKITEGIGNVQGVVGGVMVGEDVKLAINIIDKDARSAQQLAATLSDALNAIKQYVSFAAGNKPELAAVADLLGAVKIGEPKENVVVIKATVTSELIGKLSKLAQDGK